MSDKAMFILMEAMEATIEVEPWILALRSDPGFAMHYESSQRRLKSSKENLLVLFIQRRESLQNYRSFGLSPKAPRWLSALVFVGMHFGCLWTNAFRILCGWPLLNVRRMVALFVLADHDALLELARERAWKEE